MFYQIKVREEDRDILIFLWFPDRELSPVQNERLLRIGCRLSNSSLPIEVKHPIILPKESVI